MPGVSLSTAGTACRFNHYDERCMKTSSLVAIQGLLLLTNVLLNSGASPARQPRNLAVAESVDEQPVVVASDLGVAHAEVHHLLYESVLLTADHLGDRILGLEADNGRVGVLVRDAVHLGRRPTKVVQHRGYLLWLGENGPVDVLDVGRELGDDEADPGHLGVAEPRVGVGLQCPLGDRRTVPVVLEVALDALVVHDPAGRSDVALLHRQYHVVLQRLGRALHQDVIGGKPGRAYAKALATDDVLHLVGEASEALCLGDRLQVRLVDSLYPGPFVLVELADPGATPEPPVEALIDQGRSVEQIDAGVQPGPQQYLLDLTLGGI